jgi:hypothetical protein
MPPEAVSIRIDRDTESELTITDKSNPRSLQP